nr:MULTISPECIES: hypothetical protein [unclassified Streptomyces]
MRERLLAAPVVPAPSPWRSVLGGHAAVSGLTDIGFGGGLHSTNGDSWSVDVEAPDRPHHRIPLSDHGGGRHVLHSTWSTLRAAGFSPSGQTLAVTTSSDLTLGTRRPV